MQTHLKEHPNTKHGSARRNKKTKTYKTWESIKRRCFQPSQDNYRLYGGRGITVCEKWLAFEGFHEDMGDQPIGMTIERSNPDGDYCKDNCLWVSSKQQARNKRTTRWLEFNGEKRCLSEWAEIVGLDPKTLRQRIDAYGWSVERALTERVMSIKEVASIGRTVRWERFHGTS